MFETALPGTSRDWEARKVQLRGRLQQLLGDLPEVFVPEVTVVERQQRQGYTLEEITFDNGTGDSVYGYVLVPEDADKPGPAILYHHQHGELYHRGKEEVLVQTYDELEFATGESLARRGYVVLCIDAYAFGQRRWQGPAGEDEEGLETEASLFKMHLWEGRTLWGMMVRDDMLALNYLAGRDDVDAERIGAMGVSMGSTRSWWLAALDERIKATVSAACLTRYQDLIAGGGLSEHGVYYFVPGMLKFGIDTESVVGLIAPRAHLTLTGDCDGGSPISGVNKINEFAASVYGLYGKSEMFRGMVYPGVGHDFTKAMWAQTVDWFDARL